MKHSTSIRISIRLSQLVLIYFLALAFILSSTGWVSGNPETAERSDSAVFQATFIYLPLIRNGLDPFKNMVFIPAGEFQMGCDPNPTVVILALLMNCLYIRFTWMLTISTKPKSPTPGMANVWLLVPATHRPHHLLPQGPSITATQSMTTTRLSM